MIDGNKEIPPHPGDREPLCINGHGAGEKPLALLHGTLPVDVGQRAEPAHHRGVVDAKKAPDDLEAQTMIVEDKGQQDGPRGAFPELRQLGWRDLTMEQRVLQDRHGGVGWGLWGVLSCPRGQDKTRSEEHTSELQSLAYLVCRLLLEKKKK